MSLPFNAPKSTSGKIILLARITAQPGKGDEMHSLLQALRTASEAASEKDTHTYRTTRSEENKELFVVFEEYSLPNGIVDHVAADPFQALLKSGTIASVDVQYFHEFQ